MRSVTVWPEGKLYGELSLGQRKKVHCISRKVGVNLHGRLTLDEWLDLLPFHVAAGVLDGVGI